jgi:hypothetical protein
MTKSIINSNFKKVRSPLTSTQILPARMSKILHSYANHGSKAKLKKLGVSIVRLEIVYSDARPVN